jgi:hypothetical protein
MSKSDPIREKYFKPLATVEKAIDIVFWVAATLSICAVLISQGDYPVLYQIVQIAFLTLAVVYFVLGLVQRLYLSPRAEQKRRQDLLSNSFGVHLTHETAEGYYNNDQTNPIKRLSASIMESSFFTHAIIGDMLFWQRTKTAGYAIIYLVAMLNRSTEIGVLVAASQAIFSEEIISKWLRMEWLRGSSERVYENLKTLFNSGASFGRAASQATATEAVLNYESSKSLAAIVLSQRIFDRRNPTLSAEWEDIRNRLKI